MRYLRLGLRAYSQAAKASENNVEHLEKLKKYYPEHLIKSITAAEQSITSEQWARRKQPVREFAPRYADDYAEYDPLYDHAVGEWVDKTKPRQPIPQQIPPGGLASNDVMSSLAPHAINLTKLEQLTGLSLTYLKGLSYKTLIKKRVVNMTRLGKTPSYYALAVVGDGNGHVGLGEGRDSKLANAAVARAYWEAAKNLRHIPRFESRTIYGQVDLKQGAVVVNLRSAAPGSGLRVNHIIYDICKAAGIKDLVGNVYRSRNPMNVAKTALEALSTKQALAEDVAANRGKKVVDVTKTYLNF